MNLNPDPISCIGLVVSLFECAGNSDMDDPILLVDDDGIARGHEARSECGCAFLIEKSLHTFEKIGPAFGGEVRLRARQTCKVSLTKIERADSGLLRKSNDRVLICLSWEKNNNNECEEKREQAITHLGSSHFLTQLAAMPDVHHVAILHDVIFPL
jgi:hypothetical protein